MPGTYHAVVAALLAFAALALSGPGTRFGLWSFSTGILVLLAAGLLGVLAALAGCIALFRGRRRLGAAFAMLLGLAVAAVPAGAYLQARSVPRINDVSTDPKEQSPEQRQAYPDLVALRLPVPPNIAFEKAKGAIEEMGWQLAREDASAGRIEAVATTFWFGFKDDVVVRISAEGGGSRVDIRSKSRVGKGDLGTNAQRIRAYRQRLQ